MIFTINLLTLNLTVGKGQGRGSSWHAHMNLFGFMKIKGAHCQPTAPFLAWQDVPSALPGAALFSAFSASAVPHASLWSASV